MRRSRIVLILALGLRPCLVRRIVQATFKEGDLIGSAGALQRAHNLLNPHGLSQKLLAHRFRRRRQHTARCQRNNHRHDQGPRSGSARKREGCGSVLFHRCRANVRGTGLSREGERNQRPVNCARFWRAIFASGLSWAVEMTFS